MVHDWGLLPIHARARLCHAFGLPEEALRWRKGYICKAQGIKSTAHWSIKKAEVDFWLNSSWRGILLNYWAWLAQEPIWTWRHCYRIFSKYAEKSLTWRKMKPPSKVLVYSLVKADGKSWTEADKLLATMMLYWPGASSSLSTFQGYKVNKDFVLW